MAGIIAGIYEIDQEIGSGGGGIVYLGRHIRLEKKIVLKADKRKLSAGKEMLRREVDLLKGLSHTYIPQVYDFVQENDTVYTVMDYVEGESLDKILKRGEAVPQKKIIKWACQLLEALSYLHSQKPHGILHGDIKPSNIMLRPDGDICLIDFNIALALGEEGAVRAGYSRGYASPEHFSSDGPAENFLTAKSDSRAVSESGTEILSGSSQSTGSSKRRVLLDVRSDIYSLGATLYRLLSGKRPDQKAIDVIPLSGCCSPQIASIIQKAMNPDPDKRYQSAEEMLDAFLHLRTNDGRVKKNRKRYAIAAAVSVFLFLLGGICTFIGMKQRQNYQSSLTLASYSQSSLADGDIKTAVRQAVQALDTGKGIFKASALAEAQKALTDALGVYDLSEGFKAEDIITLPAAPFAIEVSPGRTRFAVVYAYEAAVYSLGNKEPDTVRRLQKSAWSDCLFIDEDTIVYAGEQGAEAYDLLAGKVLWTGEEATNLAVSGDRNVIAAVNREDDCAVLYHAEDGKKITECPFSGRHLQEMANDIYVDWADYVFQLDYTGDWLAVSFSNGGLSVFDTKDAENELILYDESDYRSFSGGFCGELFAYAAQGTGKNFFGVLDTKEAALIGSMESRDNLLVQAEESGICLSDGNLLARFAADTLEETELAYTEGKTIQNYDTEERFSMVATDDNAVSFYDSGGNLASQTAYDDRHDFVKLAGSYALAASRDEPEVRILRLEEHRDEERFSYDADYVHNEARVSGDGERLMLFDYKGFRIYGRGGGIITERKLPEAENIYDQQFVRGEESSYLEVTWYDGTVRRYGMDGTVLLEEKQDAPDKGLEEEFLTDRYRIISKLHEAPQVYEQKSGRYLTQLETDAELAYVTQLDNGWIMTEYVSTALERYGILLNADLQKVAYLPCICDVYGDTVVFDYQNGVIRSCSIYSLEELVQMGREY